VCGQSVGGREEEEAEEAEPGIQNQKQEPHTKMWGKSSIPPKPHLDTTEIAAP